MRLSDWNTHTGKFSRPSMGNEAWSQKLHHPDSNVATKANFENQNTTCLS